MLLLGGSSVSGLMNVLAPGLLEGRAIALAGGVPESVAQLLAELGARVEPAGQLDPADDAVGDWARGHGPLDALVFDAGPGFAEGGPDALVRIMQDVWAAVREVAVGALLEAPGPGKIVLIGPRPEAGAQAGAVRAALENLARTLSVEWARRNVTVVMVAPGSAVGQAELAQLTCFLCSTAGDYFSGCRIDLGEPGRAG
jgi:NAD(P)-dependent dehydrogenase (short-subunit alcohol dehydrogenase family)